jgi:hypothetical protein
MIMSERSLAIELTSSSSSLRIIVSRQPALQIRGKKLFEKLSLICIHMCEERVITKSGLRCKKREGLRLQALQASGRVQKRGSTGDGSDLFSFTAPR